jgi:predicted TIM-barrel fold metal-dependent hydrolase
VVKEFAEAGIEAVLVALDLETTAKTPPCNNDYVKGMQSRHGKRIIQAWGAVDPLKGEVAIKEARHAINDLKMLGFHFHPIMGHFAVNERRFYPLWEAIDALKVPVMIDVGTTGMGAGMPGGLGAKLRHAHPSCIDELAADFPNLTIIAAHPGWPWDGGGAAQGQRVLGAVGLGAEIFPGPAQDRYPRAAPGQDHVRQRLSQHSLSPPVQGMGGIGI